MDSSSPASPPEESPAERQARIRRQKREAKLKDDPTARLAKITSLAGRPQELAPSAPSTAGQAAQTAQNGNTQNRPPPVPQNQQQIEDAMRQLLRQPPSLNQSQDSTQTGSGAAQDPNSDPMTLLLSQLTGIPPPNAQGGATVGAAPGLPPGLADVLGGMQGSQPQPAIEPKSVAIWKIMHFFISLCLALYFVFTVPFTGSKAARNALSSTGTPRAAQSPPDPFYQSPSSKPLDSLPPTQQLFWLFITVELGLQSTRYLLEKGQQQTGGIMHTIAGFLPGPWAGRLRLASRYKGICETIVQDAMVIVFVVGVTAWWKGGEPGS